MANVNFFCLMRPIWQRFIKLLNKFDGSFRFHMSFKSNSLIISSIFWMFSLRLKVFNQHFYQLNNLLNSYIFLLWNAKFQRFAFFISHLIVLFAQNRSAMNDMDYMLTQLIRLFPQLIPVTARYMVPGLCIGATVAYLCSTIGLMVSERSEFN